MIYINISPSHDYVLAIFFCVTVDCQKRSTWSSALICVYTEKSRHQKIYVFKQILFIYGKAYYHIHEKAWFARNVQPVLTETVLNLQDIHAVKFFLRTCKGEVYQLGKFNTKIAYYNLVTLNPFPNTPF